MRSPEDTTAAVDLRWQEHRSFLVALSAAAGWLDALAFLHLGKVFISFMSGNLLFVGIGAGDGDGPLVLRAGIVLLAFLVATAIGARITGSRLAAGEQSPLGRTLLIEACLLTLFGVLWAVSGDPSPHATMTFALLLVGASAMGLQAAISLAFHLPNVATVAITATLAQLGALIGWREREGRAGLANTPPISLMILICLAYLISAVIVAMIPDNAATAFGPVLLLSAGVAIESLLARGFPRSVAAPRHGGGAPA
jgi:uncharacterized membrane protein YoaK (UPF0700 family)